MSAKRPQFSLTGSSKGTSSSSTVGVVGFPASSVSGASSVIVGGGGSSVSTQQQNLANNLNNQILAAYGPPAAGAIGSISGDNEGSSNSNIAAGSGSTVSTITTIGISGGGKAPSGGSTGSTLSSATLKRNPKIELSKSDLLRLLSILEGELQAREIVIAVLKAEQIKQMLYRGQRALPSNLGTSTQITSSSQPKSSTNRYATLVNSKTIVRAPNFSKSDTIIERTDSGESNITASKSACDKNSQSVTLYRSEDPLNALARDAYAAYDPHFDEQSSRTVFQAQYRELDILIKLQKQVRETYRDKIREAEENISTLQSQLDAERKKNEELMSQENQKLRREEYVNNLLEEVKQLKEQLESEKQREKDMILSLLEERKHLIVKLIEERHKNEEITALMRKDKTRICEMVEGLEEESKRSLQMEAELERQVIEFEAEREKYRIQLANSEKTNAELATEVERLKEELELFKRHSVGEGVRSTIVTMAATTRVPPAVPSIATVAAPRASVAHAIISPKSQASIATSVVPPVASQATGVKPLSSSSVGDTHSYAVVQPIVKSPLSSSVLNPNVIPTPPSVPAPPPKAGSTSKLVSQQATAFTNLTYQLETSSAPSVSSTSGPPVPPPPKPSSVTPGAAGKVTVQVASTASSMPSSSSTTPPTGTQQRKLSSQGTGRGAPPPIPPNKPVLPPSALQQRTKDLAAARSAAATGSSPVKTIANASGPGKLSLQTATDAKPDIV